MLGGNGILLDFHVIRHMADIEAIHSFEGTETIQSLIVGRDITGVGASPEGSKFARARRVRRGGDLASRHHHSALTHSKWSALSRMALPATTAQTALDA